MLYRLAKYASPRALAGMRPRDGDLARPLLGVGAAEIREYCRAAGVEYGEDVTNAAPLYARNVLRLEVLPRLEELNPRFSETLAATAEQAAAEAEVLTAAAAEARRRLEAPRGRGDLAAVDVAALGAEAPAMRALVLHDLLRRAMGGEALVERRLVEALLRLAERTDDAGRVSLGRGLEAVRGRGVLRIRAVAAAHACAPAVLDGQAVAAAGEAGVTTAFCGAVWRAARCCPAASSRARPRSPARASPGSTACRRGSRCVTRAAASASRRSASAARRRSRATSPPPASRRPGAPSRSSSTSTAAPPGWAAPPPPGLRSPSGWPTVML